MSGYRIDNSSKINDEFNRLCAKARSQRRIVHALLAIEELMKTLQKDPNAIGEPAYQLKSVGLPVRHTVLGPWSIHFAIDEPKQVVHIIKIALLD